MNTSNSDDTDVAALCRFRCIFLWVDVLHISSMQAHLFSEILKRHLGKWLRQNVCYLISWCCWYNLDALVPDAFPQIVAPQVDVFVAFRFWITHHLHTTLVNSMKRNRCWQLNLHISQHLFNPRCFADCTSSNDIFWSVLLKPTELHSHRL